MGDAAQFDVSDDFPRVTSSNKVLSFVFVVLHTILGNLKELLMRGLGGSDIKSSGDS